MEMSDYVEKQMFQHKMQINETPNAFYQRYGYTSFRLIVLVKHKNIFFFFGIQASRMFVFHSSNQVM